MLKLDRSTAKNGKGRFIIVTDIKLWTSASSCLYAICMYDEANKLLICVANMFQNH